MKDLLVLTADKNMKAAVEGLLSRWSALGLRPITSDVYAHPERDPGVRRKAQDFCRPFLRTHGFALVLFDREGCSSHEPADRLVSAVQQRLDQNGWVGRSSVLVFDPELEQWVWADSRDVALALKWDSLARLRAWLQQEGYMAAGELKPQRPKEAMEAALRRAKEPRSSAIYSLLARKVDFSVCTDATFQSFQTVLRRWFPLN